MRTRGAARRRPRSALTSAPVAQLGARAAGAARQLAGQRAHPADGHVPVAGAVADHVVEEAAVLAQVGVVRAARTCRSARRSARCRAAGRRRRRARPSRRSGARTAPPRPRRRRPGARSSSRRDAAARAASGTRARADARRSGRRTPARRRSRVGAASTRASSPASRRRPAGRGGRPGRACTTRPAARAARSEAELVDDRPRQQADEVGVARQPGVDARRTAPRTPRRRRAWSAAPARRTERPARARYAAATRPLWPPPTTTTS